MITGRARAAIGFAHRRHIQLIDDIHHKPRQMLLRQPIINGRRKQIRGLTVDRAEVVHGGAAKLENQSPGQFRYPNGEVKSDRLLAVVSQQVILGQPGHRCVAFDAEVGPMIVVMAQERGEAFRSFC